MRTPVFFQSKVERLERVGNVRAIIAILSDGSEKTYERARAAKALADRAGALGIDREQAVAVRRAASDRDWMIRIFAAHGFDRLRARDSLADLVALLQDAESGVREAAAAALASIGDERARPLLERAAMTDPYPWVRDAARDALETFRQ